MFINVIDVVAPIRKLRLKINSKPWFTDELLEVMRERDAACDAKNKNPSSNNVDSFNHLRNKTQNLIKKLKREYNENRINEAGHDCKKLWKTLKELGIPNSSKKQGHFSIKDPDSGKLLNNDKDIANAFCKYFSSVAMALSSKLPNRICQYDLEHLKSFYKDRGVKENSFHISKVSENEVMTLLEHLDEKKATGLDELPSFFLKDAAPVISSTITYLINLSIHNRQFPDLLKKAKILPIFKKGSKLEPSNYRPISILPTLSKLFEKIIHNQLYDYLCSNNILFANQSGFRVNHSTLSSLINITENIKTGMDEGLMTGMLVLDLQKAFDTVDHSRLLMKLGALGCSAECIELFSSYLLNRFQRVCVNSNFSCDMMVECGVPQGSILGPLFFLVYINDMSSAIDNENVNLFLYADDSAITFSSNSVIDIQSNLSQALHNLSDWLCDNKLFLHLGKTESILFGTQKRLSNNPALHINFGDTTIQNVDQVKYLGCTLDRNLNGNLMAEEALKKISSGLKFLYRQQSFLNSKLRKNLSQALLQPFFDYSSTFWLLNCNQDLVKKTQTMQNKIIRFINGMNNRSHLSLNDFKRLHILPTRQRCNYLSLNLLHKCLYGHAPSYLSNFAWIRERHTYSTRYSSNSISVRRAGSNVQKSFSYVITSLWNSLPNHIKGDINLNSFKSKLKKHLMELPLPS